jgi:cysteine desulfurase
MQYIYLDNNATTALAPEVIEVMRAELAGFPANPSSIHLYGRAAQGKLMQAREVVAAYLGVHPREVIFTSGGTEAINLLLRGSIQNLSKGKILTSAIEHPAVDKTLADIERQHGWQVERLPVTADGAIGIARIEQSLDQTVRLLVFSAANSETGVRAPIEEIAELAYHHSLPLLIDGVAWLGKWPITLPRGVSGIAFSSHKIHGPKGVGVAVVRRSAKISPIITGGNQENRQRGGTENVEGIIGFAEAVKLLDSVDYLSIAHMRDYFEQLLRARCHVQINGGTSRLCNTSNLYFPGVDGETLLIQLDIHKIAASHGSACSAGARELSHVLVAMYGAERARSSLRFSLSRYTTASDIEIAAACIAEIVGSLVE